MPPSLSRRSALRLAGSVAVAGVAGCLQPTDGDAEPDATVPAASARQFSGPGCSCCAAYAAYFREALDGELTETVPDDLDAIKREYGVPADARSCHTVLVDGYVVEGHVPASVVARLLEQRPDVDGVALPGMPRGTPGMPGERTDSLTISAFADGRVGGTFARV